MASVGAFLGTAGAFRTDYKPNKNSIFGGFQCDIILNNPSAELTPNQVIEGEIHIDTDHDIEHYGKSLHIIIDTYLFIYLHVFSKDFESS